MGTPFKMKGSPMQRNFGIGSPAKKTKDYFPNKNRAGKTIQKLWDKYGPSINPYTKTEEGMFKGETFVTKSPGWGKTKTYGGKTLSVSEPHIESESTKKWRERSKPKKKK